MLKIRYTTLLALQVTYISSTRLTPDTLAYDNGGIPARSTCTTFNLLLLGVFQQAHLPGHTNPWLSAKCCKLTYPIHCNCKYVIQLINNITALYTFVKCKKTLF